jgi:hypothetical protein
MALTKAARLLPAVLLLLISSCNILLNDVERRSLAIVQLLTSETVDTATLATMAGWSAGTDPQDLLLINGPHVSLTYVKNRQRQGIALSYRVHNSEMLDHNKKQWVTIIVREKISGPAQIVATVILGFKQNEQGVWSLQSIKTDG